MSVGKEREKERGEFMQDYIIDYDLYIEEKIDGRIFLMARPNPRHLMIQKHLINMFSDYFKKKKKKCTAIFEMELHTNDENYVQPDLMIYCKENNEKKNKKIPLIVVEVLSDSTWNKDMTYKMKKYAELGIEEYWVIDPRSQRISVYKLSGGIYDLDESYYHPLPLSEETGFSILSKAREKEQNEAVKEFSPSFFPEMTISLKDVFDFDDLDIIM